MLLLQPRQLLLQLTLFVFGHRLPAVATAASAMGENYRFLSDSVQGGYSFLP
jgi:hypothetical protein